MKQQEVALSTTSRLTNAVGIFLALETTFLTKNGAWLPSENFRSVGMAKILT
jgi:hypothetical protein